MQGKVRALSVLPDGRIATAGDDLVIRIWEGETSRGELQCVRQLRGHIKAVEALAVLLDGRLVSASQDKTMRVWDVEKESCVRILDGHVATVRAMQPLPEGFLASGKLLSLPCALGLWLTHCGGGGGHDRLGGQID
jgi:WD40 repeat protein